MSDNEMLAFQLDNLRASVVFTTNEVSGWKQSLSKDFKTPYEYYEDIIKKSGFFPKRW